MKPHEEEDKPQHTLGSGFPRPGGHGALVRRAAEQQAVISEDTDAGLEARYAVTRAGQRHLAPGSLRILERQVQRAHKEDRQHNIYPAETSDSALCACRDFERDSSQELVAVVLVS